MKIIFLGHQGWAFQAGDSLVLVDPVERAIGNGANRLPIWPERRLDMQAMPISALILTHEHSDHFDLQTLYHLPWRGTVYVPDLSSQAMTQILTDLGFEVQRVKAFGAYSPAPGLRVVPLPIIDNIFERDVYALLIEDQQGDSFLTPVDGVISPQSHDWLQIHCPWRDIDNLTNNALELVDELEDRRAWGDFSLGRATAILIEFVEQHQPRRVLITGQGWCYSGRYRDFNSRLFRATGQQLSDIGRTLYPHISWSAPQPGEVFDTRGVAESPRSPWVIALESRPRTFAAQTSRMTVIEPWTGVHQLSPTQRTELELFVREEFGSLLGSHAVELLAALRTATDRDFTRPTLGLRIIDGDRAQHYVLDIGHLHFLPDNLDHNFCLSTMAGVEIWAADLLALIKGEEEAYLVYESAVRRWTNCPNFRPLPISTDVFSCFCPRFRPQQYLSAYRRRLEQLSIQEAR